MNDKIRKHIIELLQNGEDVPAEFQEDIFPTTKKEYELKYAGKEKKEIILNDTMSVPFQAIKHFGDVKAGEWSNMLIFGDNLQALKHLLKMKEEGKLKNADGSDGVKLIYIDPPFATKQDFQGNQEQKAYQDKIVGTQFIEFLRKRLVVIHELLSNNGSLLLHLDWKKSHYMKVVLDEIFKESNFQSEIVFKRTLGHHLSSGLDWMTDGILFYSKTNSFTYHQQYQELSQSELDEKFPYIEEETNRRFTHEKLEQSSNAYSKGEARNINGKKVTSDIGWRWTQKTFDERIGENPYLIFWTDAGKPRYKRYADEYEGRKIGNLWDDITLISSNSLEAIDYPTQKPESLLQRIINMSTDENDIVLDCFAGSGTTGAVSEKLNRRWIMVDCGKLAIYTMQKRLINLKEEIGNKGKNLKTKPFTLYNAGLYHDGELLNKMQEEEYKDFVLELFGCQKREHQINGIKFHGTLDNHSVMVFDKKHFLTHEFIDDLHKNIGKSIKDEVFLIAPVGIVGFNEDYVSKDKGKVKYTILRIPNSIIDYIKQKKFTRLEQPRTSNDINQTIDSVGFDFIYPPKVKSKYSKEKTKYCIEIEDFEPIQLGAKIVEFKDAKAEALAMVMIDLDYDGKTFSLDEYYFSDQIAKSDYKITIKGELGEKIMVIYLDIFGNEKKEVLNKKDFKG